MRLLRNLRLSAHALGVHPLRTGLAVGGIAIGVAGVLVLGAVGAGARAAVLKRIERLGTDLLVVTPTQIAARAGRERRGILLAQTLVAADAAAIRRGSPAVARVAPVRDLGLTAKFGATATPTMVLGTTPEWLAIRGARLASGRFFTSAEGRSRERVVVLGAAVGAALFGDSLQPVGRTVRLGRAPFRVVGVLRPRGLNTTGSGSDDDKVLVPLQTAQRRLANRDELSLIFVQAGSSRTQEAAADIEAILRARHGRTPQMGDDFRVENQQLLRATQLATQDSFRRLLAGLGLLSLLVGGGGVVSLMLLSVRERRFEIGLRVAVGARQGELLVQFLGESLLLASVGGALGILLGTAMGQLLGAMTRLEAQLTIDGFGAAVGAVILIGLGFGVWPAWRASRMDPIAALQAE